VDDYGIDLEEALKAIDLAEVLVVRFAILPKRLLIDFRTSANEGPLVAVVPKAESLEERYKSLKRMRPRFPLPDRIVAFMWPRTDVETLRRSPLWERMVARLVELGGPDLAEKMEEAYRRLREEERQELVAAIRGGESYHSLWERPR
jgi:hypothetical protein